MSSPTALEMIPEEPLGRARSERRARLWRDTLGNILRQRNARVGLVLLGFLVLVAIFAGQIAPFDPIQTLFNAEPNAVRRSGPCIHLLGCAASQPEHLFGLDGNARDEFSRVVYGARVSLQVGVLTVGFAIVIGAFIGAIAGYVSGWTDNILMRVMDVLLSFPALLLAIAIVTTLGPGLINAQLAIGIVGIPVYARVTRGAVLSVKENEFITASRALGESPVGVLFRRVLPNSLTPLIVAGTLGIGGAILDVAALSFLGLGAQPPTRRMGLHDRPGAQLHLLGAPPDLLPGHRHRPHRAGVQPARRRPARRPRSAAEPVIEEIPSAAERRPRRVRGSEALLAGRGAAHVLPHARRRGPCGRRHRLPRGPRRGHGPRRRVRLRQERHGPLDPSPGRAPRSHRGWPRPLRWARPADVEWGGDPPGARRADRHDLPATHVIAQPGVDRGTADRGSPRDAPPDEGRRRRVARPRTHAHGRDPGSRATVEGLSRTSSRGAWRSG